jgi:hypothetical protein
MVESLNENHLSERQDQERRTLAQEQGVVLSPTEFLKELVPFELPSSVHDLLNRSGNPEMDEYWNKVFSAPAVKEPLNESGVKK